MTFSHSESIHALAAITAAVLAFNTIPAAAYTFITSKVTGDDQFKIYLSTTNPSTSPVPANPEGFQYANGFGWGFTYTNTLALPTTVSGKNYHDYWINIWVQDVGGGGPDLIGEFTLTGAPGLAHNGSVNGCKFDNNKPTVFTNTQHWKVTTPLPLTTPSPSSSPIGYASWFSNYLPTWATPTLTPTALGVNGSFPWGPLPNINRSAQWITTTPAYADRKEAWFTAHIKCP